MKFGRILGRLALILLETVLLMVVALYGVMYVLAKGPSPTARNLFVCTVQETSALPFLAELFFSEAEIEEIISAGKEQPVVLMDTSLINIAETKPAAQELGPQPDQWGLVDEDGDGIIVVPVSGGGYTGYMMVVLDPSRVTVGSRPELYNARGFTVEEMVLEFDGVAGTNAGGFMDENGQGNGSTPDSLVVVDGQIYGTNTSMGFAGFDENHILHVGKFTVEQIKEKNIRCGVCFGPVLITNGEKASEEVLRSGINPRTAIGQRSDGAVLMLVIDGRQVVSLGATYEDLADIFLEFGAVNACNLDGGSSTLMWYQGGYVNNCASVIGIRPVPTAIVVLKEGANG